MEVMLRTLEITSKCVTDNAGNSIFTNNVEAGANDANIKTLAKKYLNDHDISVSDIRHLVFDPR